MGSLTNQGENSVSVLLGLRGPSFQAAEWTITSAPMVMALMTSVSENVTGNLTVLNGEVVGGGYRRQVLTPAPAENITPAPFILDPGSNPTRLRNASQLIFDNMPACVVAGFVIVYGISAGDTILQAGRTLTDIFWGTFAAPFTVAAGQALILPPGSITVELD